MISALIKAVAGWLTYDIDPIREFPLSSFERIQYEIKPCDVLLIEGRSRVSHVIKMVTQSPWSHSALYLGKLYDIKDPELRKKMEPFYQGEPDEQILIESLMGKGVIITPLSHYKNEHIRICRPKGITRKDAQQVIAYTISKLGYEYDVRHILDLLRFLLPWTIFPRRWRSSLFTHHAGESTKLTCPQLLADGFQSVNFPILPLIRPKDDKKIEVLPANPRLFTPSDFDFSPFFDIVKYPIVDFTDSQVYHMLIAAKHESDRENKD